MQVYQPSEAEKADPRLYAENVRVLMAKHLACGLADYGTKARLIAHCRGWM